MLNVMITQQRLGRGGYRGGGGPPGTPPPSFGGPPNFIKREKTLGVCPRMARVSVLYCETDPPPFRNPVSTPVGLNKSVSLQVAAIGRQTTDRCADDICR